MRLPEFTAAASLASKSDGFQDSSSSRRIQATGQVEPQITGPRCHNFVTCCIAAGGSVECGFYGGRCFCV